MYKDIDIRTTDWLSIMQSLENGSVDAVVTDPAYWTLDKYREVGTTTRLGGHHDPTKRDGWFNTITSGELTRVMCEFYRVLARDAHAWVMSDGQTLGYVLGYSEAAGFAYCKPYPVVKMTKDGSRIKQGMGYHGRASHEYVTLLEKGRRRFNDENWPDVFQVPWTGAAETRPFTEDGKPYPTAKPLSLMQRLIELSTNEGELVCDPFLGSGTTAVACVSLGRRFVGGDCNPASVAVTDRRIADRKGLL